jgi:hypothetical protein
LTGVGDTVLTDPAGRVLLALRSQGCSVRPGLWAIPRGRVEEGETSVSTVYPEPPQTGSAGSRRRFFHAAEIPEEISLDALLVVLASLSHQGLCVPNVTDRIFSALFYSHLWPILTKTWMSAGADGRVLWTIRNIPFRKFKSAVPFLLTGSNRRSIVPALAAELLFALASICWTT